MDILDRVGDTLGGTYAADPSGVTDVAYERNANASVPIETPGVVVRCKRECGEWRFNWMGCS